LIEHFLFVLGAVVSVLASDSHRGTPTYLPKVNLLATWPKGCHLYSPGRAAPHAFGEDVFVDPPTVERRAWWSP
jgi:hypothetical protein